MHSQDKTVNDKMADTRPLLSLGILMVNNAGAHNDTTETAGYYIKKVMLGSFPKMLIIVSTIHN